MFDDKKIKKILKDTGILDESALRAQALAAKRKGQALEMFLINEHFISEETLYQAYARFRKIPYADLKDKNIKKEILRLVPEPIAITHHVIAFDKTDEGVKLATDDPDDLQTFEFIERKTALPSKVYLTAPQTINEILKQYRLSLEAELTAIAPKGDGGPGEAEALKKIAENIPVIRIVDSLIDHAIIEGASDIHIEPSEKVVTVRYRIDGVLRSVSTLPKAVHAGVVARIKILSNLKLDEHRLPQDGRFKAEIGGDIFSIRVSVFPIFDGEKIVLRLLEETAGALTLEQLGLRSDIQKIVMKNIKRPHGIILVTGPTGSGKTTTLYSILNILNSPGVNISTIEDPIEYRIPGVNQGQVNSKIGFTFAAGLRSLLRQDPNIIMIGEIRDGETADIAINAAMTGHLVFSTAHTNDAVTTLPRLLDLGAPAFLVASTVNLIVAQRLVRKVCKDCATEYKLSADELNKIKTSFDLETVNAVLKRLGFLTKNQRVETATFRRGAGCRRCGQAGFRGRLGIFEALEVTSGIAALIDKRVTSDQLQKEAVGSGMVTLVQDGFIKALKGLTTIDEVIRVTQE